MPKNRYGVLETGRLAEIDVEEARTRYLRMTGWEHTCKTPGAFWVWTKQLPDGRHLMASESLAVSMQQHLDDDEEPRPEDDESRG